MLKIKKNIPLKELEKYGFYYNKDEFGRELYTIDFNNWHYIEVIIATRLIVVYDDEDLSQKAVEKFYDLVKDGIVEKV